MKLTTLNPAWHHWHGETARIGMSLDCPVCKGEKVHRVFIDFANPFDGGKAVVRNHLWTVTGETFETLSLSPSVDYTKYDNGAVRDPNCWHGLIQNGEVT